MTPRRQPEVKGRRGGPKVLPSRRGARRRRRNLKTPDPNQRQRPNAGTENGSGPGAPVLLTVKPPEEQKCPSSQHQPADQSTQKDPENDNPHDQMCV